MVPKVSFLSFGKEFYFSLRKFAASCEQLWPLP